MAIETGEWAARAVEGALGFTKGDKEQVAVRFLFLDGPNQGRHITWYGYFTEKTTERTLESLRHAGWQGDDLFDLSSLGSCDCTIVVEDETDEQGEVRPRVRWVNGSGGLQLQRRMDESQARAFAARMKGQVVAMGGTKKPPAPTGTSRPSNAQRNAPPPHTDDDIPF